jgi:hypothetical protein
MADFSFAWDIVEIVIIKINSLSLFNFRNKSTILWSVICLSYKCSMFMGSTLKSQWEKIYNCIRLPLLFHSQI